MALALPPWTSTAAVFFLGKEDTRCLCLSLSLTNISISIIISFVPGNRNIRDKLLFLSQEACDRERRPIPQEHPTEP